MQFVLDEKDNSFIERLNRDLQNNENVPLFVNNIGKNYYINFTCEDIAKANLFILTLMQSANSEYLKDTLGITINSINYCHGDNKIAELKDMLTSFIERLDNM